MKMTALLVIVFSASSGAAIEPAPVKCFKSAAAIVEQNNEIHGEDESVNPEAIAFALCSGSSSATAPVVCFQTAVESLKNSSNPDSVFADKMSTSTYGATALCANSPSAVLPVRCYERVKELVASKIPQPEVLAIRVCSGSADYMLVLECVESVVGAKRITRDLHDDILKKCEGIN